VGFRERGGDVLEEFADVLAEFGRLARADEGEMRHAAPIIAVSWPGVKAARGTEPSGSS
jgi:hypothetical protein